MAKKFFLVDDDDGTVESLKLRLEKGGYEVVTAPNGQVALDKMAEVKPDLIVLDLNMPVMDGYSMLKEPSKARFGSSYCRKFFPSNFSIATK